MAKKATYQLLARRAKVSTATVSRVAAGHQTVDRKMRERVLKVAAQLGIDFEDKKRPQSRIIAFVLSNRDVLHPFQARVLAGAESFVSAQNWELVFLTFRYQANVPADELQLPQILSRTTPARGVILAGVNSTNLLEALQERHVPFSVLGNNVQSSSASLSCDTVRTNDIAGAREITQHLVAQGHRHIWFVGSMHFPWFARCGEGYRQAMNDAGLEPKFSEIHSDGQELGYLGTKSILSRGAPVTAIFAGSDRVASGVYSALREAALSIPKDISVVGFNDTEAALFHPALTSVREFPEELGRQLAELTLKRIKDPGLVSAEVTVPTQLVVRDSTQAIARQA